MAFLGAGLILGIGSVQGIYVFPLPGSGGVPRKIVDSRDKAPGSAQTLAELGRGLLSGPVFDFDAGAGGFYATSAQNLDAGFYHQPAIGALTTVANRETVIPGTGDNFDLTSFALGQVALSDGQMAFQARDELGRDGVFLQRDGALARLLSAGDEVDGTALNFFTLDRHGLEGNQLVFRANFALYRATLEGGSTPDPVVLEITRNDAVVTLSWDAIAAGPNAILQSTTSLTAPNWQPVAAPSNPYQVDVSTAGAQFYRLEY
jgi:hypothetical protein